MLRPFALAALLIAASAALPACDAVSSGDQTLFEDQAYFLPGVTPVNWRIGPAFDARIQLQLAPTPNPAQSGDFVDMLLYSSIAAPGGFTLYRLEADGRLRLVARADGFDGPNVYAFGFLGRDVDPLPGIYRLLVIGAGGSVIAYGDFTMSG